MVEWTSIFTSFIKFLERHESLHLAYCALGIISSLIVYGVLQERLLQWPYDGEIFEESTLFVVLCNRLTSFLFSVLALLSYVVLEGLWQFWSYLTTGHFSLRNLANSGESISPIAPLHFYAFISIANVVATNFQYEALRHISFPLQTLGKCSKMIPVMIWGTFIMRKSYKVQDYLVAVVVTLGCTVFFLTGNTVSELHAHADKQQAATETLYGVLLMVGYLGFDGFTSTFQDKLFKGYNMSMFNQIVYITMWSSVLSYVGLLAVGQLDSAISFVQKHPDAFSNIFTLSLAATIAQLFISHTIKSFGALIFATVMTVRQVFSIVLSCVWFDHPLTWLQWLSVGVVFGALYFKSLSKTLQGRLTRKAPSGLPLSHTSLQSMGPGLRAENIQSPV